MDSQDAELVFQNLAAALVAAGNIDEARAPLQRALELQPKLSRRFLRENYELTDMHVILRQPDNSWKFHR